MIETEVLIVGCVPAGLTGAIVLARVGVRVVAITKHEQLAPTPRAHVTNQRSIEIFRDFGAEAKAMKVATSYEEMPNQIFLMRLKGVEYGRIKGLLLDDIDNSQASRCTIADLPQHLLEPVLFDTALRHGAYFCFSTELISFIHDQKSVTACLKERSTGDSFRDNARYLVGADGSKSKVAETVGLPFEGQGKIGGSLNVLFECDLRPYIAHRPGLLYFSVRAEEDAGGAGLGILRCIKRWTSWLMMKGDKAGQETPNLSAQEAADVFRDYLGIPNLKPNIIRIDPWKLNSSYATVYQSHRVFCMGDAVHRHAPSNGLGSNGAIQDAYNLAWKLHLVLENKAGDGLLASHSQERVPVGKQAVKRATKSVESYQQVLDAIGTSTPEETRADGTNTPEILINTQTGTEASFDSRQHSL